MICSEFGRSREEYDFGDAIGQGGFGTVFRARCKNTKKTVAIKKIDQRKLNSKLRKRVNEEIYIQSRLNHPSILKLYAYFEDERYVYIVVEHCPNGDLLRLMRKNDRPFTEHETREYFSQVVDGTLYLHSLDIIHRDLTLCNVLLDTKGGVKIADFGLATKLKGPQDRQMTMCGTPNYMSPEVATMSSHGLETDVWSLGCMLYTLLVGVAPFETNDKQLTMRKVANVDYEIPDHVSLEARDLITKCLMPNPSKRINSEGIRNHPFFNIPNNRADSGVYTFSTTATTHHTRNPLSTISENPGSASYRSRQGFAEQYSDRRINTPPVRLKSSPVEYAQHVGMFGVLKKKFAGLPELVKNDPGVGYYAPQQGLCNSLSSNVAAQSLPTSSLRERDVSEERSRQIGCSKDGYLHHNKFSNPEGCCSARVSQCSCDSGMNDPGSENVYKSTSNHISHRSRSREGECSHSVCRSHCQNPRRECSPRPTSMDKGPSCSPNKNPHVIDVRSRRCSSLDRYPPEPDNCSVYSHHPPECRCIDCANTCTCKSSTTHRSWCNKGLHPEQSTPRQIGKSSKLSRSQSPPCKLPPPPPNRTNSSKHSATNAKPTTSESKEKGLGSLCSPIKTHRLKPVRQEMKNVILHILEDGQLCVEFLQVRGSQKRVEYVLKIFGDGEKITLYQPSGFVASSMKGSVPDISRLGGKCASFDFCSLPRKHWKKYRYVAGFVKMVKSKTIKITYYSRRAKCVLMENEPDPDFEARLYSGECFLISENKIRFTGSTGATVTASTSECMGAFDDRVKDLYDHVVKAKAHCLRLDRVLSTEEETGFSNFPVTIGRRPSGSYSHRGYEDKENQSPQTEVGYKPTHSMSKKLGPYEPSVMSVVSNRPSRPRKPLTPNQDMNIKAGVKEAKTTFKQYVDNIGWVFNDGHQMKVDYLDGSVFRIEANQPSVFLFTDSKGLEHKYRGSVPNHLLNKISKFHEAMKIVSPVAK